MAIPSVPGARAGRHETGAIGIIPYQETRAHGASTPSALESNARFRNKQASDGGGAGPAPPTNQAGVNDDDQATLMEYEISVPFERRSCQVCMTGNKGNFVALILNDEIRHMEERHSEMEAVFICAKCGKRYKRKHPALCHVPKCTAPEPPPLNGEMCRTCGKVFKTKSGVSQHERHEHPEVRNAARAGGQANTAHAPRKGKIWTEEEEALMLELEIRFSGERNVASCMQEFFPGKTGKQIRDKRALASYKKKKEEALAPLREQEEETEDEEADERMDVPEEGGELPATPGSPPHPSAEEQPRAGTDTAGPEEEIAPDSLPEADWREGIAKIVLESESPDAIPPGAAACVQLLKGVLAEIVSKRGVLPEKEVMDEVDKVVSDLLSPGEEKTKSKPRKKTRKTGNRKQYIYARTQELYRQNPGLLVKYIRERIDWTERTEVNLGTVEIRDLYNSLWGKKPQIDLPDFGETETEIKLGEVLTPVSGLEIKNRLARTKANVAPGPDGITKKDVQTIAMKEVLRLWFNIIMVRAYQPVAWRTNRTTLLPKEGQDKSKATNYRPITISSILARLYWGIVDQKLRKCVKMTLRQKGFTSEAGCFNNVHILSEVLRHTKVTEGLVAVQLDVSKAFDTVPHEAVRAALRKKGLPELVVRLVADSYEDVYTKIQNKTDKIEIKLQRGVKQGDPLSPLIFNLVMEPMLQALESQPGYKIQNETSVSVLAFADDIILLAGTAPQASNLLRNAEGYLRGLGMSISAAKCATFRISVTKDSWYLADPGLTLLSGEGIPYAAAGTSLKYLGMKISPWAGIDIKGLKENLCTAIQAVKKLALKPYQKVHLISTYLVPHYLYQLVLAAPPVTYLRQLDQELRVVIKDIYHLPQSTTNGLIYCGKRDGGLGFPKLETLVVSSSLRAGLKFSQSEDEVMRALAEESGMVNRLKSLAASARINWPVNLEILQRYKKTMKKQELASWAALVSQGKSVQSLTDDKIGNAWLYKPTLLKPCRFITALKMRTNTTANRVAMNRAGPVADIRCRKCKAQPETLAHILGQCTVMKEHTIRRHNEILELIIDKIVSRDKEAAVTRETNYKMPSGGNLKPDLVIQSRKGIQVVDVTVRHEDNDYLAQGHRDKIDKYSRLLPHLQRELGANDAEVLPIVVGARGAMPKETVRNLAKMKIADRKTLITISLIALRNSIEQYHMFMDYDATAHRRRPPTSSESFRPTSLTADSS